MWPFLATLRFSHGDPRVNIQSSKGKAKTYQVKPVLLAIDRLESKDEPD